MQTALGDSDFCCNTPAESFPATTESISLLSNIAFFVRSQALWTDYIAAQRLALRLILVSSCSAFSPRASPRPVLRVSLLHPEPHPPKGTPPTMRMRPDSAGARPLPPPASSSLPQAGRNGPRPSYSAHASWLFRAALV